MGSRVRRSISFHSDPLALGEMNLLLQQEEAGSFSYSAFFQSLFLRQGCPELGTTNPKGAHFREEAPEAVGPEAGF